MIVVHQKIIGISSTRNHVAAAVAAASVAVWAANLAALEQLG